AASVIRQQLQRRRRHGIAGEVMLQCEQTVEAERFGEIAELQMLVDDGGVRAACLAEHVERDSDFHGWHPLPGYRTLPIGRAGVNLRVRQWRVRIGIEAVRN